VAFNIVINAILIPRYGFRAAAISTILSELVVGTAFQWYVFRHLSPTPWWRLFWRLGAATLLMVSTTWLGAHLHVLLGLLLGISVYLAATIFLRVFTGQERKLIAELLPVPVRNQIATLSHE
jgi:O-antigen/teichoic acid export membrane protein